MSPALPVVSMLKSNSGVRDGAGNDVMRTTTYRYGGMKADITNGRGPLGFAWQEAKDEDTGILTRAEFRQDYPFVGTPSLSVRSINGAVLARNESNVVFYSYNVPNNAQDATPTVGASKRYRILPDRNHDFSWDLAGNYLGGTRTISADVDAHDNVRTVVVESIDANRNVLGYGKTTTSQFLNDTANWIIGRPTRVSVLSTVPNTIVSAQAGSAAGASTISGTPFMVPAAGRVSPAALLMAMANMVWDSSPGLPNKAASRLDPIVNYLLD